MNLYRCLLLGRFDGDKNFIYDMVEYSSKFVAGNFFRQVIDNWIYLTECVI